jgi:putative Mg2+ transporter-C (MgtC) family protein
MLHRFLVRNERTYHGRAAGMRTYGLVCMASAALVVMTGYPDYWFGGRSGIAATIDPTRTVQGIVTGIGFLGAGVIMKEGFNISGLTTAASLWASSAIGVLVCIGFYWAAILLALLSAFCMIWVTKFESWLPSRQAVAITLCFKQDFVPHEADLRQAGLKRGYELATGSLAIACREGRVEWRFVAVALNKKVAVGLSALSAELAALEGVESFSLAHARN